ncbi:MAG: hypothetical protein AMXMBFR77_27770 [Phycisphaerales bacterium]
MQALLQVAHEQLRATHAVVALLERLVPAGPASGHELAGLCAQVRSERDEPRAILRLVAERFRVSVDQVKGRASAPGVRDARSVACHLLHERAGLSYTAIGKLLDGRDHSTTLHLARAGARLVGEAADGE